MLGQYGKSLAGDGVPDPGRTIGAAGRHAPPIGAEGRVPDVLGMQQSGRDGAPGRRVPHLDLGAIRVRAGAD